MGILLNCGRPAFRDFRISRSGPIDGRAGDAIETAAEPARVGLAVEDGDSDRRRARRRESATKRSKEISASSPVFT